MAINENGTMSNGAINIYDRICCILVDALGIDKDDITPDCQLQADLGAESIDYLDIVFRVEHEFSIKISKGELFPEDAPIEKIKEFKVRDLVNFVQKKLTSQEVV